MTYWFNRAALNLETVGGPGRNRTGMRGFAVRCITTLPPDRIGERAVYIGCGPKPGQARMPVGGPRPGKNQGFALAERPAGLYKWRSSQHDEPAMDSADPAFIEARNNMVDSQVRPNKVSDPRILAAMRRLPRERFLPPGLASLAYADEDVPLGRGRALLEPMVIARLVQLTAVSEGERVLVVASGPGYGSGLLAPAGGGGAALGGDPA